MLAAAGLAREGWLSTHPLTPWKKEIPKDKERSRTDNVKFLESKMPPIRQVMLKKLQQ